MANDSLSLSVRKSGQNDLATMVSKCMIVFGICMFGFDDILSVWWFHMYCGIRQYIIITFIEEVTFK